MTAHDEESAARRLAAIIRGYWAARGAQPTVVVEKMSPHVRPWLRGDTSGTTLAVVRSDMVDGRPRGFDVNAAG